jgi:hypothetical protein
MLALHIIAGLLSLLSGAVALGAAKAGTIHRRSGIVFVGAMLFMSASGAWMAMNHARLLSVVAGGLTFYLVATAMLTVRRPPGHDALIDAAAMLLAAAVGAAGVSFGFDALGSASGEKAGYPAAPYFIFGAVAWLAAALDARMLLARGVQGAHRLARHLWRMCFALLLATASFFLGQSQVFPEATTGLLLAAPVLAVLLLIPYWLVRVLFLRRRTRRSAPAAAAPDGSAS